MSQVTPLIIKASIFARKAHEGQVRKYSGLPYIQHPARVAGEAALLPEVTEEEVASAWLHDVVEDTSVTLEAIRQEFGDRVADLVDWLTNPKKVAGENRAARKAKVAEKLAKAPREAKRIKMLDRIDNLYDTAPAKPDEWNFARLYIKESEGLLESLADADADLAARFRKALEALRAKLPAEGKAN